MWIIAATTGPDNIRHAPVILDFTDSEGWKAWEYFCEFLHESRAVAVTHVGHFCMVAKSFSGDKYEYFVEPPSGKVLTDRKIYSKL